MKLRSPKAFILFITIFSINISIAQWNILPTPNNGNLNDIFFLNDKVGFIAGDSNTLLKTTNGISWNPTGNLTGKDLSTVYFVDDLLGYASGVPVGSGGQTQVGASTFLSSSDGGDHWNDETGIGLKVLSMHFINDSVGFATGPKSGIVPFCSSGNCKMRLRKTTNGGNSWFNVDPFTMGVSNSFTTGYDVTFYNDSVGFLAGGNGRILKSTDTGKTWVDVSSPEINTLNTSIMKSVEVLSPSKVIVVGAIGAKGVMLKSLDAGLTWDTTMFAQPLNDISFFNNDSGYLVGDAGYLAQTNDGGDTWAIMSSPSGGLNLSKVTSLNDSISYIVGEDGLLMTSLQDLFSISFYTNAPDSICKGEVISFTNNSSFADTTSFKWYINDALYSSDFDTSYAFDQEDTYEIKLKGMNIYNSEEDSFSITLVVLPQPEASFTHDQSSDTISVGEPILFTNTSLDGDTFEWFKGGTKFSTNEDTVSYTFGALGFATITLKVKNGDCEDEYAINFTITQGSGNPDDTTSVNDLKKYFNNAQISPNPASDEAKLILRDFQYGHAEIQVLDMLGQTIYTEYQHIDSRIQEVLLSVDSFEAGSYIILISSQDKIIKLPLVKMRR